MGQSNFSGPVASAGGFVGPVSSPAVAAITQLTAATGTTGDTVADVGGAFNQTTLNNNFKVLADKINALIAALD